MSTQPEFSFIIPVFNAALTLRSVLTSVTSEASTTTEVIVVDNGSTDDSVSIAEEFPTVKLLHCKARGRSQARNFGAQIASKDYLVFVDADTILEPHWLEELKSFLSAIPLDLVATSINPTYSKSFLDRYRRTLWAVKTGSTGLSLWKGAEIYPLVNTAACAVKRRTFEQLKGFNQNLSRNEDLEFSLRVFSEGFMIGGTKMARSETVFSGHSEIARIFSYLLRSFEVGRTSPQGLPRAIPFQDKDLFLMAFHVLNLSFVRLGFLFNRTIPQRLFIKPGLKAKYLSFIYEKSLFLPKPRVSFIIIDEEVFALTELSNAKKLDLSPTELFSMSKFLRVERTLKLLDSGFFQRVS